MLTETDRKFQHDICPTRFLPHKETPRRTILQFPLQIPQNFPQLRPIKSTTPRPIPILQRTEIKKQHNTRRPGQVGHVDALQHLITDPIPIPQPKLIPLIECPDQVCSDCRALGYIAVPICRTGNEDGRFPIRPGLEKRGWGAEWGFGVVDSVPSVQN